MHIASQHQPNPGKAGLCLVLLRHAQFSSAATPSPYLNTARSVAQREIVPGIQVRDA